MVSDTAGLDRQVVPGSMCTAVLLHPHPDMGGDRFNHVVDAMYRSLPGAGFSVVRFDFSSSDPTAATADTGRAIGAAPDAPVVVVGYSFGADIAVRVGVDDPRVAGWFLVAPPFHGVDPAAVAGDPRPKAVVVPEHDQFSPPERARLLTADWTNTTVSIVTAADHFLAGRTDRVTAILVDWLRLLAPRTAG